MHKLTQFRLCPHSRSIRLALDELSIEVELVEEQPWQWRAEFLALNPAGELPVLQMSDGTLLCGAYSISEYIAEQVKKHPGDGGMVPLFPGNREDRAEIRRLIDWFHGKMDREVTRDLLFQKVHARFSSSSTTPAPAPDTSILRALRANLGYHLSYVAFLAGQRRWLAGEELSFADLAAAAHFSVLDYLGEVPFERYPDAKIWYQRIKSRKSFRPLLADRISSLPPPIAYSDLDF
ncbi:MAG TPA: glutathione S-transferase family protein [Gammaproteobacteria bacterium]|nr:glutathione S-transferase family protein [Gammaproteobacteria bacterium]